MHTVHVKMGSQIFQVKQGLYQCELNNSTKEADRDNLIEKPGFEYVAFLVRLILRHHEDFSVLFWNWVIGWLTNWLTDWPIVQVVWWNNGPTGRRAD